jgi:hypothetical protein
MVLVVAQRIQFRPLPVARPVVGCSVKEPPEGSLIVVVTGEATRLDVSIDGEVQFADLLASAKS